MSREKQIDTPTCTNLHQPCKSVQEIIEMAQKLVDVFNERRGDVSMKDLAEVLFADGYRKQSEGEWIDQHNGKYSNPIYVCSQCRKGTLLRPHINELDNMEMVQALSPFCPNCGAHMTGGKNE